MYRLIFLMALFLVSCISNDSLYLKQNVDLVTNKSSDEILLEAETRLEQAGFTVDTVTENTLQTNWKIGLFYKDVIIPPSQYMYQKEYAIRITVYAGDGERYIRSRCTYRKTYKDSWYWKKCEGVLKNQLDAYIHQLGAGLEI